MLNVYTTNQFKKDYKRIQKRGINVKEFEVVVDLLAHQKKLPEKYQDHQLFGNYKNHRECHIKPDVLLIYKIDHGKLTLTLMRMGSHADLF